MLFLNKIKTQFYISFLIVAFGFSIFELRSVDGITGLTSMTYDSLQYIKIIEGGVSEPPFSTRVLLIYLCKILPFAADISLFIVNLISILLLLVGVFLILNFLNFSNQVSILAVISASSSFVFVYNFNNPFLTDLPAIASLVFFLAALIRRRFYLSIIFCCISLLFRESMAALVPMFFLFFNIRQSLCASFFASCAYILPKIFIAGNVSALSIDRELDLLYLLKFFMSYGVLWLVVVIGYFILRNRALLSIKFEVSLLLLSFGGAILSSLHAADVTRMFFLMFPSIVIGAAYFFEYAISSGQKHFVYAFTLLGIILSILLVPNYFSSSKGFDSFDVFIRSNLVWVLILFALQVFYLCKILLPNKSFFIFLKKW